ncbi:hypothetical protein EB73_07670 [Mycobacterium sp. SWH-M3]|nr:hypothetical protein EB73_07670 [Mycobacterium sp. SWH-M3]
MASPSFRSSWRNSIITSWRTVMMVAASAGGMRLSEPPKVSGAAASAQAISAAAMANDVMICSLVYSISVPAPSARSPRADIACESLSTE